MIKIIAKALFQQICCQSLSGKNKEKAIIFLHDNMESFQTGWEKINELSYWKG